MRICSILLLLLLLPPADHKLSKLTKQNSVTAAATAKRVPPRHCGAHFHSQTNEHGDALVRQQEVSAQPCQVLKANTPQALNSHCRPVPNVFLPQARRVWPKCSPHSTCPAALSPLLA